MDLIDESKFKYLKIGATSVLVVISAAIAFGFTYKYNETIFIRGTVVSKTPIIPIKNVFQTSVEKIKVKTNQKVNKNDLLMLLDCDEPKSNSASYDSEKLFLGELLGEKKNSIQRIKQSQELASQSLKTYIETYKVLAEQGAAATMQLKDYENQLALRTIEFEQKIADLNQNIANIQNQLATLDSNIIKNNKLIESCTVKSPVDGIVSEILVKTSEYLPVGTQLAKVFENSRQEIVFTFSPNNLPYLNEGDVIDVRVDAYPFDRYGSIEAKITSISPISTDLSDDNTGSLSSISNISERQTLNQFIAKAVINKNYEPSVNVGEIPILKDGMALSGLIISGDRRLIYIFTDQLIKIQDSIKAMRSRF